MCSCSCTSDSKVCSDRRGRPNISPKEGIPIVPPLCFIVAHEPPPLAWYHWAAEHQPMAGRRRRVHPGRGVDAEETRSRTVAESEANGAGSSTDRFFCTAWRTRRGPRSPRTSSRPFLLYQDHELGFERLRLRLCGRRFSRAFEIACGVNLPQTHGIVWLPNDAIPLTLSALGRFVENSAVRYPCHVCLIDATGSGRLTACSYEERSEP